MLSDKELPQPFTLPEYEEWRAEQEDQDPDEWYAEFLKRTKDQSPA